MKLEIVNSAEVAKPNNIKAYEQFRLLVLTKFINNIPWQGKPEALINSIWYSNNNLLSLAEVAADLSLVDGLPNQVICQLYLVATAIESAWWVTGGENAIDAFNQAIGSDLLDLQKAQIAQQQSLAS